MRSVHPFTTEQAWLELRASNLNSTEIAVLFGKSPYLSLPELWDMKRNRQVQVLDENDRMFWGKQLQDAIAHGAATKNGWTIRAATEYIEDTDLRIGASFDYETEDAIVEIKNVDYLQFVKEWVNDDAGLQAPVHIELQLQHQMMLKGKPLGRIVALVGGNTLHVIERSADAEVQGAMAYKAAEFWRTIDADQAPELDFVRDADFILAKYREVIPRKMIDVRLDPQAMAAALAYKTLGEQIKALTEQRKGSQANLAFIMQDAQIAQGEGFKITRDSRGAIKIS